MRSDEQRDECIDTLMARVQALEAEIARLKAEHRFEAQPNLRKVPEVEPGKTSPTRPLHARDKTGLSLENAIGTRWIGRVGMIAILFGVAFFLKYSFDNKLIGEAGRVTLGICCGAAFIGAGEYLQKKSNLELYGQMLSGGGLAVLYLSLYASFALYHLIPLPLAAAGLLAVTISGTILSVRYATYALAAIALLGGFLTPVMLSTGQNQPITLFGYVLLLDLGTLLLFRFRPWASLVAASLLGTAALYFDWHAEFFSDDQQLLAFAVVATFFGLYNLYLLTSRPNSRPPETRPDLIVILGSVGRLFLAGLFRPAALGIHLDGKILHPGPGRHRDWPNRVGQAPRGG